VQGGLLTCFDLSEIMTVSDSHISQLVALRSQRQRLGLSAANYGKLIGVTGQTIYSWEQETSRPRKHQFASIAALRHIGKREAQARLEQLQAGARKKLK